MHLSKKKIKGKTYTYVVKSIRLHNGKNMKLSKLLKYSSKMSVEELNSFFEEKTVEVFVDYAKKTFQGFKLQDVNALSKIELMRLEYKKILSKLSKNQLQDLFD